MRVTNVLSWCLLANQFTGTLYQGFVTTLGDARKGHSGQSNTMHVITELRFPLSIKDPTVSGKHTSSRRTEETTLSKENCSICNVAHPAPLVPQKKSVILILTGWEHSHFSSLRLAPGYQTGREDITFKLVIDRWC